MISEYTFSAPLWEYGGKSSWVFVTVPRQESDDIANRVEWRPGFGWVRVAVSIGETEWVTSLFPSKELGAYVLPVKRAVRQKEVIDSGETVTVSLHLETDSGCRCQLRNCAKPDPIVGTEHLLGRRDTQHLRLLLRGEVGREEPGGIIGAD